MLDDIQGIAGSGTHRIPTFCVVVVNCGTISISISIIIGKGFTRMVDSCITNDTTSNDGMEEPIIINSFIIIVLILVVDNYYCNWSGWIRRDDTSYSNESIFRNYSTNGGYIL